MNQKRKRKRNSVIFLSLFILFILIWMFFYTNNQKNYQFKRFIYADEEGYLIGPKKSKFSLKESY